MNAWMVQLVVDERIKSCADVVDTLSISNVSFFLIVAIVRIYYQIYRAGFTVIYILDFDISELWCLRSKHIISYPESSREVEIKRKSRKIVTRVFKVQLMGGRCGKELIILHNG